MVLIVFAALRLLTLVLFSRVAGFVRFARTSINRERAINLAEAGVETVVRLKVDNASLSILEYDKSGEFFRLSLFNDTSHLD